MQRVDVDGLNRYGVLPFGQSVTARRDVQQLTTPTMNIEERLTVLFYLATLLLLILI